MLYIVQNLPYFLVLLGALVFFHELGHFLVAKACGVRVLKFSLGFGPRLFGFTKNGTDYVVSALPLGGYVKMLGEQPGADIAPEERRVAFSHKPVWQRAAIVAAGPAFNFVLAFFIYTGLFTGVEVVTDTRIGVVTEGEPAWRGGLRPGDRVTAVNGEPVSEWMALREAIGSRPGQTLRVTFERRGEVHTVDIVTDAHEEANFYQEVETRGRIGVMLQYVRPIVGIVDNDSPAAQAGLRTGDEVLRINGVSVGDWYALREAVQKTPSGEPVRVAYRRKGEEAEVQVTPAAEGPEIPKTLFSTADTRDGYTGLVSKEALVFEVERGTPADLTGLRPGDRLLALTIKKGDKEATRPVGVFSADLAALSGLDATADIVVRFQRGRSVMEAPLKLVERTTKDELKNEVTQYVFGATNDPDTTAIPTYDVVRGPLGAMKRAFEQVGTDTTLIATGLAKLVQRRVPLDTVGGPIMLFVIAEKTAKRGAATFLALMAVISVNLGLVNLIPIPVLDGGHLLFCAVEAIRRRPPSLRFREMANVFGLVLLLLLMIVVFKNDILRYVLG